MSQRLLVKKILENPLGYSWTVQGFGMLRMYLDDEVRLHIWDKSLRVEGVSDIHTHPWDFESEVIVGKIINAIYNPVLIKDATTTVPTHWGTQITTGEDAKPIGVPKPYLLMEGSVGEISEGFSYMQKADSVHRIDHDDSTITIIQRSNRRKDSIAGSYWPAATDNPGWVSAAPRPATWDEVVRVAASALERHY